VDFRVRTLEGRKRSGKTGKEKKERKVKMDK